MRKLITAFFLITTLAACSRTEVNHSEITSKGADTAGEDISSKSSVREDTLGKQAERLSLRDAFIFDPAVRIQHADSWDKRVIELPQQEQAVLHDIDARYYGANKFTTAAEQRELANQGFPMPEEWLAASRLADEELEQMANTGNIKARMFYSDRLGSRLMGMQAANIASASSEESQRQLAQLTAKALVSGAELMRTSNSPFAAYVYGRSLSGASKGAQPEAMAGAFFAARDRGDLRATMLMASFERENPQMNSQTIMAAYSAMSTLSAK